MSSRPAIPVAGQRIGRRNAEHEADDHAAADRDHRVHEIGHDRPFGPDLGPGLDRDGREVDRLRRNDLVARAQRDGGEEDDGHQAEEAPGQKDDRPEQRGCGFLGHQSLPDWKKRRTKLWARITVITSTHHRGGRGIAEFEALEGRAVDEIADRLGVAGRGALRDDVHGGEHRQDVDAAQHQGDRDHRPHHGQRDGKEDLAPARAVQPRGLLDFLVLALQRGHEDDEEEGHPLPHVGDDQHHAGEPGRAHEVDVAVGQPDAHQQVADDAAIVEEQLPEEGHGGRHEEHRQQEQDAPALHPAVTVDQRGERQRDDELDDRASARQ